ncbi:unnamed protein product [Nesidiocoris tenuis]|uniref:Uncharacterized protein n=1 Tax=Nesidiocoris tenuis TaxID=355587 RepID=A0A6H5HIK2_9HEMI|nr:unnamed protein product [Nesidiocoris tenuis]
MLTVKADKGLHGKQVNHPTTIFSTNSRQGNRPACVASYTEKKLLVLKNYVFYESRSSDGERSDALDKNSAKNSCIRNSTMDASDPVPRSSKNHSADRRRAKPKSWKPNGGGMRPYNSPEVQNAIPAADECIIDVNTVKPKVDTWFRPRNDAKLPNKWIKYGDDVKQTKVTRNRASDEPPNPQGNNCPGKTVKRMTSFWDSHLKSQPHTMATMLQKSHISLDSYTRLEEKRKEGAAKNLADRPRSQGSDCVVQEHTLRPSELLNRQGKLISIEDILINAKSDDKNKKEYDPEQNAEGSNTDLPQASGDECSQISDDRPSGQECLPNALQVSNSDSN